MSLDDLIAHLQTIRNARGPIDDLKHVDPHTGDIHPLAAMLIDDDGTVHPSKYARGRIASDQQNT
jgi:hypothetical protein